MADRRRNICGGFISNLVMRLSSVCIGWGRVEAMEKWVRDSPSEEEGDGFLLIV